ncbi:YncE family protein [Cellulomonas humilata]|uniref:YVTN family beta-propeller protein n=1 Tax=Cellulomonas humilata TaxID=144055 RepID=A0ABU0E9I4_9CELL|nr:hypothetical protein [Cellulomonas humilata]MDQ0371852.1 YVTN family beta-propeller protein [Cellulomonas humilata]
MHSRRAGSVAVTATLLAVVATPLAATSAGAAADPLIDVGARPLGVAFSADGSQAFVANNDDSTLSVIDPATGAVVATIPTSPLPFGVTTSPGSPTTVYTSTTGDGPTIPSVDLVDPASATVTRLTGPLGNPSGVAADASFVYATNATGQFTRWPAAGGAAQGCELQTPTRGVVLVGTTAYVTQNALNSVAVVDTTTFACPPAAAAIPVGVGPWGIAYNPVRGEMYVVNATSATLSVISTSSNTVIETLPIGPGGRTAAVSPDGDRVYVSETDGLLRVLNRADPALGGTAVVGTGSEGVAASSDGLHVYVTNAGDGTVSPFTAPSVTTPADVSVGPGAAVTFSVTTQGDVTGLQWERSNDGGTTWSPIPDATEPTYSFTSTLADNGARFRVLASSIVFPGTQSESATLTVTAPPPPSPSPTPAPTTGPILAVTGSSSSGGLAALAAALILAGGAGVAVAGRRRQAG